MDAAFVTAWIGAVAGTVEREADQLGRLDAAIGDGDHGTNLNRGFVAARAALRTSGPRTPGAVLTTTGRALILKVGGASGPLYGGALRAAGKALDEDQDVGAGAFGDALHAALAAIQRLGKAEQGDKTMVDAFAPAVAAYDHAIETGTGLTGATRAAADAALAGAEATVPLLARKGRASYLGERSVGHKDPGAASTALLFVALAETAAAHG